MFGGTTLTRDWVSCRSQRVKPGNVKNHYVEKILPCLSLNLTVYIGMSVSSFTSKTPGEKSYSEPVSRRYLFLAYIFLKIGKLGKISNYDVIMYAFLVCM